MSILMRQHATKLQDAAWAVAVRRGWDTHNVGYGAEADLAWFTLCVIQCTLEQIEDSLDREAAFRLARKYDTAMPY